MKLMVIFKPGAAACVPGFLRWWSSGLPTEFIVFINIAKTKQSFTSLNSRYSLNNPGSRQAM